MIGVPESTIHEWLINEWRLHDFVDTVNSTDGMKQEKARTVNEFDLYK